MQKYRKDVFYDTELDYEGDAMLIDWTPLRDMWGKEWANRLPVILGLSYKNSYKIDYLIEFFFKYAGKIREAGLEDPEVPVQNWDFNTLFTQVNTARLDSAIGVFGQTDLHLYDKPHKRVDVDSTDELAEATYNKIKEDGLEEEIEYLETKPLIDTPTCRKQE